MKVSRLGQDSSLNAKFLSETGDLDNLRREFENELSQKIEEREQLKDRLIMVANLSPDDLEGELGPEGYLFIIEEITVEITDSESIRTERLRKLKRLLIMNIRLSHEVFEASREARHYEGLWELASVDENIILHNHLYSVLISLREQLDELYQNTENSEVAKLQAKIGDRTQDIITLQKQNEYLTQEIFSHKQRVHEYDLVLKEIDEDDRNNEYRQTLEQESLRMIEAEKLEQKEEQELETQRQLELQNQIEERMRREQLEAEREEKLKNERLQKQKLQKLELERRITDEITREKERQKKYEEDRRKEQERQRRIEEEQRKALELKRQKEIEEHQRKMLEAQRKKEIEQERLRKIRLQKEKEAEQIRQKEIQELKERELEDQRLREIEEQEKLSTIEVTKKFEHVKTIEKDSKQAYLDESSPANESSAFNLNQRLKDYNITVEESKQGGANLSEDSSVTKVIKTHYGADFGIQEYLDESNLQKIQIQEEHSKENEYETEEDKTLDDQVVDDTGEVVAMSGFTRNIVKKSMSRDVFEKPGQYSGESSQELLQLWVPYQEDLIRIFREGYRNKLIRVSETDFKFSGKKFKFFMSSDNRLFAKTKEKMWILSDFVDHYKDFDYEETTSENDKESYSYSKIIIQEQSYYDSSSVPNP